jgi:transposase
MFVRKKKNPSGVVSVQIIDKSSGRYKVVKTVGSSDDPERVEQMYRQAYLEIPNLTGQQLLDFTREQEEKFIADVIDSISDFNLKGPELLLGKLFNEIGFSAVKDKLFRHLVITRLVYPVSKLKTIDYLYKYQGIVIEKDKIYRYLDKLYNKHKEQVRQISYQHTAAVLGGAVSVVFYDVTTLYFEAEDEDDLRRTGFSKDGKHRNPQILLGLLVSTGGYPLAYEIFEGNKFEGHTMLPVIEAFKEKYKLEKLIIIADAGLLSNKNLSHLQDKSYEYILGARIKNETEQVRKQVLSLKLGNGESAVIRKKEKQRLIVSYSRARAQRDAKNRQKGLEKLERQLASGKLGKKHINNRGYNKYLKLHGEISITIDYEKYQADALWDGLKGYLTNTRLSSDEIISSYQQLWQIERAFRISKTDLRIRPVYHRLRHRIEAHICIAFCAYKIYKELDRQLREKQAGISPEQAIDVLKTIYAVKIQTPYSTKPKEQLLIKKKEQSWLLKLFGI